MFKGVATGAELLGKIKSVFPTMRQNMKKGQSGRIAVIGGSYEFTGAPYYSAISSLKIGGDLAHIFCSKSSASSLKAYSPELIVHPLFVSEEQVKYDSDQIQKMHSEWIQKIKKWQKAIFSWVIGPGLGRDKYMESFFPLLINSLPEKSIVVIDADGIYYLCQHPQLFEKLKKFKTIITPNHKELTMLEKALKIDISGVVQKLSDLKNEKQVEEFSTDLKFPDFSILVKGEYDVFFGPDRSFKITTTGGLKRCGGVGDILAGAVATCAYWNMDYGAVLASIVTRTATKKAFQKEGRGLTAPKILEQITAVIKELEPKRSSL